MTDQEHQKAQELATEAAAALRAGDVPNAKSLYRRAAEHEARAFAQVPEDKARTRGIVGVSLCALHYKAAQYDEAERVARTLVASQQLPGDARAQLEEIAEAARKARMSNEVAAVHAR